MKRVTKIAPVIIIALFVTVMLTLTACGKKMPPKPPENTAVIIFGR